MVSAKCTGGCVQRTLSFGCHMLIHCMLHVAHSLQIEMAWKDGAWDEVNLEDPLSLGSCTCDLTQVWDIFS